MNCALYNVPYSASFFEVLAQRFLNIYKDKPLELANVLFLVPNKRSVQNLKEAFLGANDFGAFLLPKIMPVYEVDEDEVFFEEGAASTDLPAAISKEERLFLFAALIAARKSDYGIKEISYAQSLSLATCLGRLIDDAINQIADPINQELSFEKLEDKDIVPEEYAAHWQINLDFLKIVTSKWPEILKERNLIDASLRRNILLQKQAAAWANAGNIKIVAAGLGVPFNALRKVIKALGQIENAEIYLYGLDKNMPLAAWENLSKTHPQYEKKELLEALGALRTEVKDVGQKTNADRENLVAEVFRDADTTDSWRLIKNDENLLNSLKGVSLVEAEDGFEEALTIALIMREVLQTPQKTAALVTPDRKLARMVSSALKRFGVDIDDTAGLPLHLSKIGIYLRQILDVLENDFSDSSVAALLKNDLFRLGKSAEQIRQDVRAAEHEKRLPRFNEKPLHVKQDAIDEVLDKAFKDLKALYEKECAPLSALIKAHVALAEKLAQDDLAGGAQNLWRHEDGRTCASAIADILEHADTAGEISPKEYAAVFLTLLSQYTVRKPYGTHPRLKILGLIEARFCSFDVMIAGSLNEGVWPKEEAPDPFMSRAMKKAFGLPAPEKEVCQTADDLCGILNAKEVYLTRAMRLDGVPTTKSKYWLRLETVMQALGVNPKDNHGRFYLKLAQKIDQSANRVFLKPVMPRPPVSVRPRKFSASSLTKWMKNPYEIYAKKILGLQRLDELDAEADARDFGNLMHRILERFCKIYPKAFDDNASKVLKAIAAEEIQAEDADKAKKVFWSGLSEKMLDWFLEEAKKYRADIKQITTEVWGKIVFNGPAGEVVFQTRADRVDETTDGAYNIADYKTGSSPLNIKVVSGYEAQLPLEAVIAEAGGFEKDGKKLAAKPVENLIYIELGKKMAHVGTNKNQTLEMTLAQTKEHIQRMINVFDDENTPYLFNPNPHNLDGYPEYEHLARFKEWKGGGCSND